MRVFTCTPKRFVGDPSHFARESGLFSVGLSLIGVKSRAIMPGPPMDGDDPRLLRTDYSNLESKEWWESLKLDGLILYSWAAPRYNRIVEAASRAGIKVLANMDTSGVVSPLACRSEWLREAHVPVVHGDMNPLRKGVELAKLVVELATHRVSRGRLRHYAAASVISACTPHAAIWIPNEAIRLGRSDLAEKFVYLPHPQMKAFRYDGSIKEPLVISVGRWHQADWGQKNPRVLLKAYASFLEQMPGWKGMIVGAGASDLPRLLGFDVGRTSNRLSFLEHMPAAELPKLYQRARIGFWSSRWEGQQGTGAQALCCGCTVVAPFSAQNSCFRHYVSRASGRLAWRNEPSALALELVLEARAWEAGYRDPEQIGSAWSQEFHADAVAARALRELGLVA
ncbi:glycosyltransferase [Haloferula sp. A504]|uniref:glycosyltransferase n=1 Tax=Haloferula sp. A504 TaxID=3373601 RepID=UPI0037BB1069